MNNSLKSVDALIPVLYTVRNLDTKEILGDDYLADEAFLTICNLNKQDDTDSWVFYITNKSPYPGDPLPWEEAGRPKLILIQGGLE